MDTVQRDSPKDVVDIPPSPLTLVQDGDPNALRQAEQRLAPKSRLSRIFSPRKRTRSANSQLGDQSAGSTASLSASAEHDSAPTGPDTPISLDNSALAGEDIYTDRYEWAILYENQRGITIFSLPYYSSLSLLPSDPSPFTLPNTALKRSKQPPISPENYPLPDGNWHWVSRCWMIDMRSDTGEVQHDGYEYNWMFRRHNWRAQIGSFNAGGWVRRRRWVRLMVRPAKPRGDGVEGPAGPSSATTGSGSRRRMSMASTFPPSVNTQRTDDSADWAYVNPDEVWVGDCEGDWQRCRGVMKRLARDGRKLELWKLWLGYYHPEHKDKFFDAGKQREKQWTEDESLLPSELTAADRLTREYVAIAPQEHVLAVLRIHGQHILSIFVFPESRVQFLQLLAQAGLLPELNVGLGVGFGTTEIEFWSYVSGLGDVKGAEKLLRTPSMAFVDLKAIAAAPQDDDTSSRNTADAKT